MDELLETLSFDDDMNASVSSLTSLDSSESVVINTAGIVSIDQSSLITDPDASALPELLNSDTQASTSSARARSTDVPTLWGAFEKRNGKDRYHPHYHCLSCKEVLKTSEAKRLVIHVKKCPKMDDVLKTQLISQSAIPQKKSTTSKRSTKFYREAEILLANMIVANNLPFRLVESQWFKAFCKHLSPKFRSPSRSSLSSKLIPLLTAGVRERFNHYLEEAGFYQISIEFDHWHDIAGREILGVVATLADGFRYLVKLDNVTLRGKLTENIREQLADILKVIPNRKINAIMSDSAPSCKAAREQLISNPELPYMHIIQYRCIAHFINSIGNHLTSQPELVDLFLWATRCETERRTSLFL